MRTTLTELIERQNALAEGLGALDARSTAWIDRLDLDALLADGRYLRRTQ